MVGRPPYLTYKICMYGSVAGCLECVQDPYVQRLAENSAFIVSVDVGENFCPVIPRATAAQFQL